MSRKNLSRTERIDVRASSSVKLLLQEAARACHKNVSEFLLDAGVLAAHQALADRRHFALDRPVQAKPRLQQLLSEPGALDRWAASMGPMRRCRWRKGWPATRCR